MINSKTPSSVDATPAMAGRPVVLIASCREAPETGYATLKLTVPLQYPKISPRPNARKTIELRRVRSEFIMLSLSFAGILLLEFDGYNPGVETTDMLTGTAIFPHGFSLPDRIHRSII